MTLSDRLAALRPQPAKVLTLDIETSPAQVFTFSLLGVVVLSPT